VQDGARPLKVEFEGMGSQRFLRPELSTALKKWHSECKRWARDKEKDQVPIVMMRKVLHDRNYYWTERDWRYVR